MTINPNFITYLNSRQYSNNTIESYSKTIEDFLNFVNKPENEVNPFDVMNWMTEIGKTLSASSVCLKLSSIKTYFDFLATFGLIEKDPTMKIKSPKKHNKPKHYMNVQMVHDMIDSCKNNRDKAIITTFALTGMRVSELTELTLQQYQDMKARGDNQILIIGKGNKERYIVFNAEVQMAIDNYLCTWLEPRNCDKLFLSFWGNEIARNNLNGTLKSVAKDAGIPFWKDVSNHALRSACASIYAESGMPVANIRDMLGHESIATTSRYIKASQSVTSQAVLNMNIAI